MKPTATLISVAVLIAGVFCSGLSTHAADLAEGLVHRWQLNQEHVAEGAAKPLAGKLALRNADSVRFAVESPEAAVFSDRGSTQLFLEAESTDPTKLSLPKKQFTAEAWVRVDQPLEWGGVFGIIEDNGNYERGWLLGYRKSRFFFALSTEKPKRLTYLHSPVDFEVGSWYHIAGVWDGTVQSLYVDGELIATSKAQGGPVAYPDEMKSAHFGIGAYWVRSNRSVCGADLSLRMNWRSGFRIASRSSPASRRLIRWWLTGRLTGATISERASPSTSRCLCLCTRGGFIEPASGLHRPGRRRLITISGIENATLNRESPLIAPAH